MEHLSQSGLLENAWDILQLVAVAAVAGWVTERLLDTGVRTRGLPFLSGLFGLYVGPPLLHMAGLPLGANVLFMTVMATAMPYVGRG